jgi:hypothetical protein
MAARYNKASPWGSTKVNRGGYLDFWQKRFIPADPSDIFYEIAPQYTYRPDLLAFDLYGTPKLWWVFTERNNEVLKDPIFDFVPGTQIYLPKKSTLSTLLGV